VKLSGDSLQVSIRVNDDTRFESPLGPTRGIVGNWKTLLFEIRRKSTGLNGKGVLA